MWEAFISGLAFPNRALSIGRVQKVCAPIQRYSKGVQRGSASRVQCVMHAPIAQHGRELFAHVLNVLSGTIDIGPFRDLNVETAGLAAAIGGGLLVATLIASVIVRF